jgi:uncharacterized protein (TIRG00374 family)
MASKAARESSSPVVIVLRYAAGALLGAGALYACVARLQSDGLAGAFRIALPGWVAAAAVSVLLTLALVTVRWRLLVGVHEGGSHWRVLWDSVVLGQAVNILVPLRFGEGMRLVVTCRGLGLPPGRVVVAVGLERVLDIAAFATAVLALLAAGWLPASVAAGAPAATALAAFIIVVILALFRFMPAISPWLGRRAGSGSRVSVWLEAQTVALQSGWSETTGRRRLFTAAVLTAMILTSSAMTNLLVFRAFALTVPVTAALVLLVVLQVGTAIVSVPGNIGVFHYLTVITLAQWHVSAPVALATAIVLHAVSVGPKILLAPMALVHHRHTPAAPMLADSPADA